MIDSFLRALPKAELHVHLVGRRPSRPCGRSPPDAAAARCPPTRRVGRPTRPATATPSSGCTGTPAERAAPPALSAARLGGDGVGIPLGEHPATEEEQ